MISNANIARILLLSPIVFFGFSRSGQAQGMFIQPNLGYGLTRIYNKEDSKEVDYTKLNMNTNYGARFGLAIGKDFRIEKMGLSRISLGANYVSIAQTYSGKLPIDTNTTLQAEALRRIQNIQIPLIFEFNFKPTKSVQPIVHAGLSLNYLLQYNIHYESLPNGEYKDIKGRTEIYSPLLPNGTFARETTITSSHAYFKAMTFWGHLGAGANIFVNDKFDLSIMAMANASLMDVENKREMDFVYDNGLGVLEYTTNPYEEFVDFTEGRFTQPKRGRTTAATLGLQVGLTYKLFKTPSGIFKN